MKQANHSAVGGGFRERRKQFLNIVGSVVWCYLLHSQMFSGFYLLDTDNIPPPFSCDSVTRNGQIFRGAVESPD